MRGVSFTFWSLNPDSGDTGGILADDWLADPRPALAGALIRGGGRRARAGTRSGRRWSRPAVRARAGERNLTSSLTATDAITPRRRRLYLASQCSILLHRLK